MRQKGYKEIIVLAGVLIAGISLFLILKSEQIIYLRKKSFTTNSIATNNFIMFKGQKVSEGEVFNFAPSDNCVADEKVKLVKIDVNAITIIRSERKGDNNRKWFLIADAKQENLTDNSCLVAYPVCMDVGYQYCFEIKRVSNILYLDYSLKSESTMPKP